MTFNLRNSARREKNSQRKLSSLLPKLQREKEQLFLLKTRRKAMLINLKIKSNLFRKIRQISWQRKTP